MLINEEKPKRKPYVAPKLRPLDWAELTHEQQAWARDELERWNRSRESKNQ